MSLIIASQMEDGFNADLRAHPSGPTVLGLPDVRPWDAAEAADVLLVRPTPAWRGAQQAEAPSPDAWPGRLRWVYSASAGVDFYPPWLLDAPLVTCGRGVASDEIADYVMAAICLQAKDLEGVRARSLDGWKNTPLGRLGGSTVGVVGLGAIGAAVARRALAFDMRVAALRRRRDLPSPIADVLLIDDLAALLASADHIVLALPATDATRGLIDAAALSHARPTAHLINVARGSVLDQLALVDALDGGRLGFATLDVTEPEPLPADHPLWTHPRVRLTPHVASNHTRLRGLLFDQVAANLDRLMRGEPLHDRVDPVAGY